VIRQIELSGAGEVVRVQPDPPGSGSWIAVKCAQPIAFLRLKVGDSNKSKLTTMVS
jgi:hypothetical protein